MSEVTKAAAVAGIDAAGVLDEIDGVDAAAPGASADTDLEAPTRGGDDIDRLLGELTLEEDRPPGQAYSYDRELAERGRWVRWAKLGPEAYLRLAKTKNRRYTELWDKAVRKYGDRQGSMEIMPVINGKTLITGIRGVRFVDAKTGEVLQSMDARDHMGHPITLGFDLSPASAQPEVPGAPPLENDFYLADTYNSRVNLLRLFAPDLGDEVFTYCNDEDHYFDSGTDEETRGN